MAYQINVTSSGAVLLGRNICCDGFKYGYPARVQTHIHVDHLDRFETSKGLQNIYLSEETRSLLISEFNSDLRYRQNLVAAPKGKPIVVGDERITLIDSGHMLGAVQVQVEDESGIRYGYSGDFQWPLEQTIKVDALVIDSTYGVPESVREYCQEDAENAFLSIVLSRLQYGPIYIKAHRGTTERAVQVLCSNLPVPLLGSERFCRQLAIYAQYGYFADPVIDAGSESGREIMRTDKYVRILTTGDKMPVSYPQGTTITLSAYMTKSQDPVLKFNEQAYRVSMSNHADFNGTLDYIKETGAKYVLTDNTRGGNAVELASQIKARLDIEAYPSCVSRNELWGE